jgi:peptidoglycan hydrolase-like protein with peptidoglycan-binding domain
MKINKNMLQKIILEEIDKVISEQKVTSLPKGFNFRKTFDQLNPEELSLVDRVDGRPDEELKDTYKRLKTNYVLKKLGPYYQRKHKRQLELINLRRLPSLEKLQLAMNKALKLTGKRALKADGIYGPSFRRAVIKFQRAKKLADIDGLIGRETFSALMDQKAVDTKGMQVATDDNFERPMIDQLQGRALPGLDVKTLIGFAGEITNFKKVGHYPANSPRGRKKTRAMINLAKELFSRPDDKAKEAAKEVVDFLEDHDPAAIDQSLKIIKSWYPGKPQSKPAVAAK